MQLGFRTIVVWLALWLLLGPFVPVVAAQQAPPPPAAQPVPPPPPPAASTSGTDAYDVGAGLANVFVAPGKVVLCTLSGVTGVVLLALTFGSAYRAATRATEQGCAGKWYVTGKDLRPPATGSATIDGS